MSYTLSRAWRKRFTRQPLASWLLLGISGCVGQVEVHPEYERIGPTCICVEPVGNETIHDLHHVSFGGILQRVLAGPETLDVSAILRASLDAALIGRGYETQLDCAPRERETGIEKGPGVGYDAQCRLTIEEWSSDRVSSSSIRIVFRVELDRVPTGERLFTGRYRYAFLEESGEPHASDIPESLAGAVKTALTALPQAPR